MKGQLTVYAKRADSLNAGDVVDLAGEARTVEAVGQWAEQTATVEICYTDGSAEVLPLSDLVEVIG